MEWKEASCMDSHPLPWWQQGVIYQIYPRSFKDSNGDGIGDLQGIINQLDYLSWLGVDAIWISPFYPSPMFDFGYDITHYCDIDPIFGDLNTFDKLVEQAHRRDLKVIIDFVPNHTSDQHHSFLKQQPDLNWRNPAVQAAMFDVLRFWLERGVDGFRIDVANFIMKDPQLRDNPPNSSQVRIHKARGDYDSQLHIHDRAHPDV